MSLLPEINQASAEINKFVAQANIHQTIAPVNPAEFTSPADTLLLASRDPVIREVSVGMTGEAYSDYTVSGTPPLSLPNSLGKPLKAWSVGLSPYQEGTGDPSPDNVRAIHGTDKVTIITTGANLLPTYTQSVTQYGVTYTVNSDGSVTVNGTATATNTYTAPLGTWQWDGVQDVWLSGCPTGGNYMNGYSLRVDPIYAGYSSPDIGNGVRLSGYSGVYNLANIPLRFCIVVRANTVCDNLVFRPMLNFGLSALPYTPYTAINTYSITLSTAAGTVYGGVLTVNKDGSGSIVVDRAEADLGTLSWTKWTNDANTFVMNGLPNIDVNNQQMLCEAYAPLINGSTQWGALLSYDMRIYHPLNGTWVLCRNTRYDNASSFKESVQGVRVVYPLATPITYTLTSPTIPTPTGTATTWATAEDGTVDSMEVTYVGKA